MQILTSFITLIGKVGFLSLLCSGVLVLAYMVLPGSFPDSLDIQILIFGGLAIGTGTQLFLESTYIGRLITFFSCALLLKFSTFFLLRFLMNKEDSKAFCNSQIKVLELSLLPVNMLSQSYELEIIDKVEELHSEQEELLDLLSEEVSNIKSNVSSLRNEIGRQREEDDDLFFNRIQEITSRLDIIERDMEGATKSSSGSPEFQGRGSIEEII